MNLLVPLAQPTFYSALKYEFLLPMSKPQFAPSLTAEVEKQFAALREQKGLKIIAAEQEGAPLATLPDNLYGFTFSTVNESTPLFAKRQFQSFEIHKLQHGVVHLLGFLTEKEAAAFFNGKEQVECHLYPEPRGESTRLVEVPLDQVARARAMSRSDGNYLPLILDTAS
ncbi:MAG: hypothetical protein FJW31_24335 [Acidobacteria bacterium]|nr:hypothetical protein [Acidobacteriota bacterium]